MAEGYFIRLGDKTDCGGKVLEGDNRVMMYGIEHAREGDRVSCGKNNNVYKITGGIPFMISHGKHVAGTLDSYSTCPCRARLIASSHQGSYEKPDNHISSATSASAQPTAQTDSSVTVKPKMADPALPIMPRMGSRYGRTFTITHSETGQPLPNRKFISVVDGRETVGVTDTRGLALVKAPSADSSISVHALFHSPARLLDELTYRPMTGKTFKTSAQAYEVIPDQPLEPISIPVNDRAATREALIRQVRSRGHEFVERSHWKAHPPKNPLKYDWDYSMIALHHAGRSYSCGIGTEQMLATQEHQQNQDPPFDDIGYHFGIDCSGTVYEGRDIRFKGSSVLEYNTGVIGVVLLNNLTTPEEGNDLVTFARQTLKTIGIDTTNRIPTLQMDATLNLITALKSVFTIKHFGGHKEYPGQTKGEARICPGHVGMKFVKNIRIKTQLLPPPAPREEYE